MKIKFDNITLTNFLSFGQASLSLRDNGYTLVSGVNENPDDLATSNGSGKSSIWEAISWCLTGETIRGTKDVVRIGSTNGCSVSLDFTIDNDTYKVVRTKDPTNLRVVINGEDKSGKGIRDTEKLLQEYIPDLTSSLIGSVIILGQGLPQRFTNNSPSGRKEVLEKLSKSDFMIADLKDRISNRKVELSQKLRDNEDSALSYNSKKQLLEQQVLSNKERLASMSGTFLTSSIERLNDEKQELTNEEQELSDKVADYSTIISNINLTLQAINSEYQEKCQNKKDASNSEIVHLEKDLSSLDAEIRNLENEIKELDNVKDVCPTCGQKLPNVHKIDTSDKKSTLDSLKESYKYVDEKLNKTKKDLELDLLDLKCDFESETKDSTTELNDVTVNFNDCSNKLNSVKNKLIDCEKYLVQYNTELTNFENNKRELQDKINQNEAEINEAVEKILYYNNEIDNISQHIEVVNKMATIITRDFRGYLLTNVIDFINKKSKEYSKEVFETDKIDFTVDGNNISISYDGKEYECLSGGEKQKVDLIVQLAIRDMLCKFLDFSSNIIVLDELFDNLDTIGCQKVLNLISSKLNDVESIFIVTHHSDISIPCDKEITVVKGTDKISRIK